MLALRKSNGNRHKIGLFFRIFEEHIDKACCQGVMILPELPQGVVIEVRRGGHDALAKLASDMARLRVSGYIRIERRPKDMIPSVSQVVIHESQPKLAIHETEVITGGLEALIEIERDSTALDALISLVELSNEDVLRIINLYPDFILSTDEHQTTETKDDWWNYVKLNTSSWRREARLPEQEVIVEAPEYIQQLTKAKLQKFDLGEKYLNYGDTLLHDSPDSEILLTLAGLLASHGRPVIVFSRHDSRYLIENFDIPKSSCVKMTSNEVADSIPPNPDVIKHKVTEFLWENKQAIVVFSDVEYLISINDFISIMNMFRDAVDEVRTADHLLLVHCNMEVMTDIQRHTFEREFDSITTTYLDNLVMDAESLLDHPICMELTEEELSWIEQQIKFSSGSDDLDTTDYESISGGASNFADEDLSEAKENLDRLVSEWQDKPEVVTAQVNPDNELTTSKDMVSNLVEKAFSANFDDVPEEANEEVLPSKSTSIESPIEVSEKAIEKVKTPRQALRIKRTRKAKRPMEKPSSSQVSIKAASQTNVKLPNIREVTQISSRRQAIDSELNQRSSKIDNALKNMLTSKEREKSRELSQALNQNRSKVIQDIPMAKTNVKAHVIPSSSSNAAVIASSNIVGSDGSKRRSRESASRSQNTIDIEKNYRKWSTEYDSKSSGNDHDYAELYGEEGDK